MNSALDKDVAVPFGNSPLVAAALEIACSAHAGQVDKGGRPYIEHPVAVAQQMLDVTHVVAALLHDVLEDAPDRYSPQTLLEAGIPEHIVAVVDILTRRGGEMYFSYIDRIKVDPVAIAVKLADLRHNSDKRRLAEVTEKDGRRLAKYKEAICVLEKAQRAFRRACPCPKCGSLNRRVRTVRCFFDDMVKISCPNCGFATGPMETGEQAKAAWNSCFVAEQRKKYINVWRADATSSSCNE